MMLDKPDVSGVGKATMSIRFFIGDISLGWWLKCLLVEGGTYNYFFSPFASVF